MSQPDQVEQVAWRAQPGPQLFAIQKHLVPELFFGGAVGGGKSDFLLGDYAQDVPNYGPAWRGIMFRKSYPELEELITRSKEMYGPWFQLNIKDCYTSGNHQWTFPNGATLKFRHAEDDGSWTAYLGHQYCFIGYDELPHWQTPTFYQQLKTRLRSAQAIPNKRIRASGNPGGAGHEWIKNYFGIDRFPQGSVLIPQDKRGDARMFVKSKVTDNKILLANDPGYVARLSSIGSESMVKMYLEGRWDVITGAFYPEFDPDRHIVKPFEIPKGWMKFRAMDWGSAAPFCVHWYAVSDGSHNDFPRGALICYREYYGAKLEDSGVYAGLKMTAEEVAEAIKARERSDEKLDMSVIDPSAFKEDGGPSIAARMGVSKVHFQKADNARKAGWDALRQRLKGDDEGRPMIYWFSTCEHIIRTLPLMQHDTGKAAGAIEDIDTKSEDHAADTVRYACMSRPWVKPGDPVPTKKAVPGQYTSKTTFNELMEQRRRARVSADD